MKRTALNLTVLVTSYVAISSAALAQSWACHKDDLTRQVDIFYPDSPAKLPCKVYYSKPKENVIPRALWDAKHSEGYCERKAEEFVDKLRSLGWECGEVFEDDVTTSE